MDVRGPQARVAPFSAECSGNIHIVSQLVIEVNLTVEKFLEIFRKNFRFFLDRIFPGKIFFRPPRGGVRHNIF